MDSLAVIQALMTSRTEFMEAISEFSSDNSIPLLSTFLLNERYLIEILYRATTYNQVPITITFPTNFLDAVPVVATPTQINNVLENVVTPQTSPCAICQDAINEQGVKIRLCNHAFHRPCISTWFDTSCVCPVCRVDIRTFVLPTSEVDPLT